MMIQENTSALFACEHPHHLMDLGDEMLLLQQEWDAEAAQAAAYDAACHSPNFLLPLSEIITTLIMGAILGLALLGMIR